MKTLIADDDAVSALILRKTLERLGHEAVVARDGVEALSCLSRDPVPVIISDWMMPRMDGLELCRHIRAEAMDSYTYVILLTAKTQRHDRLEALAAGVDDFLTKPLDTAELGARINVASRIVSWDQQLRELNASLIASSKALAAQALQLDRMRLEAEYLATHDSLTGCLTRRAWFDFAVSHRPTALAMFDVDNFKSINDRFGHPIGDDVLREVARRLSYTLEPSGRLGRVGGEEFGCIFEASIDEVERLCAKAVRTVAASPITLPTASVCVTVSAGLSPWLAGARIREDSLARSYEAADTALYEAKRAGRNRLVMQHTTAA